MDELKREAGLTPVHGTVGVFDTPVQIYHACEQIRDAGFQRWDAYTPFPVHGLDKAMGQKPTIIPFISLAGAIFGLGGMLWLSYYVSWDYPLNISGKPVFSYQAYVPLYFELMVLFCAFATFFGLWGLCRLPAFFHPVMTHSKFPRATDDRFLICIEATDAKYDAAAVRALLEKLGAHDVEEVHS
jgi:hypothetical protein